MGGSGWTSCTVRTSRTLFERGIHLHVMSLCPTCDLIDGIFAIEQRRRLLQRPVLGLYDKEPQIDEFECEPADVHELRTARQHGCLSWMTLRATYVVFPSKSVQCDRVDVLVKDKGD